MLLVRFVLISRMVKMSSNITKQLKEAIPVIVPGYEIKNTTDIKVNAIDGDTDNGKTWLINENRTYIHRKFCRD